MSMLELDELYETKKNLQSQINNFFKGDIDPHLLINGYQTLLGRLDDVEEEIKEVEHKINS